MFKLPQEIIDKNARGNMQFVQLSESRYVTYQIQGLSGRRDERSCFLAGTERATGLKVYFWLWEHLRDQV